MEKIVNATVRPLVDVDFSRAPREIIDYAAGLLDADGCIQVKSVSISQSQRGVACLHFIYDNFGGEIETLCHTGNANHQQAYEWRLRGPRALQFAVIVVDSLLLKKREAICFIEYKKTDTGARDILADRMRNMKHIEHDVVPADVKPTLAYFGGFMDGEGCFDTHGKSSQHHTTSQSWRPICDVFERRFGGTTSWSKEPNNVFKWTIHTFADEFVRSLAPFIVGKKEQIKLIMEMKPGEAMDVHCKLRELKGNIGHATPKIDAHLAGEGQTFVYGPKDLPRGVHPWNGKFIAKLRRNGTEFNLGSFETIELADAQYKKYKKLVEAEKRGGQKVDLSFNTRENRLMKLPPVDKSVVLPRGIYVTKFNSFQVRYHPGDKRKPVQLGTHMTLELAKKAYADYAKSRLKFFLSFGFPNII